MSVAHPSGFRLLGWLPLKPPFETRNKSVSKADRKQKGVPVEAHLFFGL